METGQLSAEERSKLCARLSSSHDALVNLLEPLSISQWRWQPSQRWSVSLCAEHLLIVERLILRSLYQNPELSAERGAALTGKERLIFRAVPVPSVKVNAPAEMHPKGTFESPHQFLADFESVRQESIKFVNSSQMPFHHYVFKHFTLGDLTGYQWLWLLPTHCERHTNQICAIMQFEDFPTFQTAKL